MALTMQLFILVLLPAALLLPPAARAGEIIGGWEAQPHSRPYMAYLDIHNGTYRKCGGFLVSENFVLTAAHCNGGNITVVLGAHSIRKRARSEVFISMERPFPHPDYNNTPRNNDIMLLKLSYSVMLTNEVSTINLPRAPHTVLPGTMCSTAGWGDTSLNDTADTLREVNLMVIRDQTCSRLYPHYNHTTMLCAGDRHGNKTAFKGDSGGPLVCGGVAEGIVSYGKSKRIVPLAVYTRISHFLPWINYIMTHF